MRDWTQEELVDEEKRLERETHTQGIEKFWHTVNTSKRKEQESQTNAGMTVLKTYVDLVAKEITTRCDKNVASTSGIAIRYIKDLRPEIVALIALRIVIDGISRDRSVTSLAAKIGEHIEDEARYTALGAKIMHRIAPVIKHTNSYVHKRIKASKYATVDYKDNWHSWRAEQIQNLKVTVHIGTFLLSCITVATGMIYIENIKISAVKENKVVRPSQWILDEMQKRNLQLQAFYPQHLPMVCPPKAWTNFTTGGYLTDEIPQLPFVKTRWLEHRAILKQPETVKQMSAVYEGVNNVQNTGYRINTQVLDTLMTLFFSHSLLAGLPYTEKINAPTCPVCGEVVFDAQHPHTKTHHKCFEKDLEAFAQWKHDMYQWHQKLLINASLVELVSKTISIAKKFKDYPAIYFPMNCDFRGRLYSIPEHLHPQGCDYAKGLLEFATGKRIETEGAKRWLQIAGANHWGIDKVSFDERIAWVNDHKDMIKAVASAPLDNTQWTEADEPFQFLNWAIDYAGYLADPENYRSHAVIAMDGSCNGLQHFSALLRDPVGAAAVNLKPSEKPSDIYQIVADKVIANVQDILNTPDDHDKWEMDMATRWMSVGISRKTTKRSVMVVPYGGTRQSCREYVQQYLLDKLDENIKQAVAEQVGTGRKYDDIEKEVRHIFPFTQERGDMDIFKASVWLSKFVWEAISNTVIGARSAMSALQTVARLATKAEHPVQWTTPDGFVVYQSYKNMRPYRLATQLLDTTVQLSLSLEQADISSKDQTNGISPNFIHSMDATALIKTVNESVAQGIKSFAMVHDSYGTHAADAEALATILRDQFIHLYQDNDQLQALWMEVTIPDDDTLPEIPARSDFNLEEIRQSLYFFA